MNGITLKAADEVGRRQGAALFARAMGRADPGVAAWLYRFSNLLAQGKIGHFVTAQHKDRVVGYGALIAYIKVGWIAFMATEPELQGEGIGSAVMRRLMELAREMGVGVLKLDATDVGLRLYSKFGFSDEYPARRCEIPGLCTRGTRRDSADCVSLSEEMPDWCRSMDLRAFGDDRSPIIQTALMHGAKLLLVPGRGYGLVDGKKLGPLVAADPDAAIAILASASGLGASVAYVPLHSELAEEFVARLRIPKEEGPITCCMRMRLGEVVEQEVSLEYADYSAATG